MNAIENQHETVKCAKFTSALAEFTKVVYLRPDNGNGEVAQLVRAHDS